MTEPPVGLKKQCKIIRCYAPRAQKKGPEAHECTYHAKKRQERVLQNRALPELRKACARQEELAQMSSRYLEDVARARLPRSVQLILTCLENIASASRTCREHVTNVSRYIQRLTFASSSYNFSGFICSKGIMAMAATSFLLICYFFLGSLLFLPLANLLRTWQFQLCNIEATFLEL
jgi:hypothetical protein